jgi:hypothetical protein
MRQEFCLGAHPNKGLSSPALAKVENRRFQNKGIDPFVELNLINEPSHERNVPCIDCHSQYKEYTVPRSHHWF